jgi:hypothetical protein
MGLSLHGRCRLSSPLSRGGPSTSTWLTATLCLRSALSSVYNVHLPLQHIATTAYNLWLRSVLSSTAHAQSDPSTLRLLGLTEYSLSAVCALSTFGNAARHDSAESVDATGPTVRSE